MSWKNSATQSASPAASWFLAPAHRLFPQPHGPVHDHLGQSLKGSIWQCLGRGPSPTASSPRTVYPPSSARDHSRDESSGGSTESRHEVHSMVHSEVHISGGVEHHSRRESTRTEERTSRPTDQGIRVQHNARGMMAAHRIMPPWGHSISRGFTRAPDQYDQWEGFEPDKDQDENEDEERDRRQHWQLHRDSHSKL